MAVLNWEKELEMFFPGALKLEKTKSPGFVREHNCMEAVQNKAAKGEEDIAAGKR